MIENKKIKNATKVEFNGIKFRSKAELSIYKLLISLGITPEYESQKILLFSGFIPTVPFYTKNIFKKKNKNIQVISNKMVLDNRDLQGITYTPDFYFEYKGKKIYVEVKGFCNDLWVYKCKLFRAYLETLPNKTDYEFWEINTKIQLLDCLKHLDL